MASLTQVGRLFIGFREIQFALVLWVCGVTYALIAQPFAGREILVFLSGLALWLAGEYPTHRFLLHAPKPPGKYLQRLHKRLHYGHHLDPARASLIFIPLFITAPMAMAVLAGAYLITQSISESLWFFCGFWLGLLGYEFFHLSIHAPLSSRNAVYRWLVKTHALHHFKNEKYWFGVTHPMVDMLMGTNPNASDVEKSKHARTLDYPHGDDNDPLK